MALDPASNAPSCVHASSMMLHNELAIDLAVDPALACSVSAKASAGQALWTSPVGNADLFPHGRQAIQGTSAPKALDIHHVLAEPALWWVTTAVVAILIAVFVLHRHLRSRHLRSRVSYDLLPTTTFDPSLQGVLAFAHQLGRVRPVHGWVPKAAVGVRVRFSTDEAFGKLAMSVEGRESITGVISKLTYPEVEIRRDSGDRGDTSPRPRTRAK
ncbi:hypothetical protein ACFWIW_28220 [Amycolatopsis sp. NPDC058340]|uniref:hypothetical protein n=1 Tax=Amycolatopsis sp. NPDC058340 TaxID=3346453 RepID=UPI0036678D41